jgi:hypothetical protein
MEIITIMAYGVVVIGLAVGVFLAVKYLWQQVRNSDRRWVGRSGRDRRRRTGTVAMEQRRSPRRQEDIANQFLAGFGKRAAVGRQESRAVRQS